MKKYLFLLLTLFPSCAFAQAVQITTQMSASAVTTGTGVAVPTTYYHQVSWSVTGNPATCTFTVDSSADNMSFSAGGAIPSQTCTSGGTSSIYNAATGYIRLHITAFSGSGSVKISYTGYSSGTGAGQVTSGTGAPSGSCTNGALYTNISNGTVYSCNAGTWAAVGGSFSGTQTDIVTFGAGNTLADSLVPILFNNSLSNMFIGPNAGNSSVTGSGSTAFGVQAGAALTIPGMGQTSADNTFIGYQSGLVCTTCRETTAIGYKAGGALVGTGGGTEDGLGTYIGSFAGVLDRGISNTMIGQKAGSGLASTSATNQDNVFVGVHAAANWIDGKQNVFVGRVNDDGNVSSTGDSNVAVGYNALFTHATSMSNNTCIGSIACRGYTNSDATMVGHNAGWQMTSGYQIALFGENAGQAETTAGNITALGFEAGKNATAADITYVGNQACLNGTTGANNTCLGSLTTLGAVGDANSIVIGKSAVGLGSNTSVIGNSSSTAIKVWGALTISSVSTGTNADFLCLSAANVVLLQTTACTVSSARFKENIHPLLGVNSAVGEIMALRPVTFNMVPNTEHPNPDNNAYLNQIGLIAENVAAVDPRAAIYEQDGITPKSYRQESIIALLVKAVQEQQREIEQLKSRK